MKWHKGKRNSFQTRQGGSKFGFAMTFIKTSEFYGNLKKSYTKYGPGSKRVKKKSAEGFSCTRKNEIGSLYREA